jgi:2-polyprenyl-6-methoxyphenol hydroxylase-like FAD-dependent oxidoreductase
MSKPLEILISGAGVAGPCISYWFTRAKLSAHITIIERFPRPRTSGQAVDIRDAGVDVIQAMGLEKAISEMHTTEEGFDFIYRDGVNSANFPATGDASSQSFTSEYEILRGDLGKLFYDATKDIKTIEYVFDEYVTEATENADGKKVRVAFANHLPEKEFDLVIGADGMVSTIRKIVWGAGPDGNQYLSRLGQYMAFFTIPKDKTDNKNSQW